MVPWTDPSVSPQYSIGSAAFTPCAVYQYDQHTDTQTTLRVTSVAIGGIYAVCAMRPNKQTFLGFLVFISSVFVLVNVLFIALPTPSFWGLRLRQWRKML